MIRKVGIILLMMFVTTGTVSTPVNAKQEPTIVHVAIGKVSEVVFPDKIANVIKGGAPDSVLVEVLEKSVYILPKTNTPADIFITTISGQSFPLSLVMATQQDVRIDIPGTSRIDRPIENIPNSPMDIMKYILLGQEPPGATPLKTDEGKIFFKDAQIQCSVHHAYEFPALTAYVLEARNLTRNSIIVPVEQMLFPNLLAVASDRDMISAKGQEGDRTMVYLVVGK